MKNLSPAGRRALRAKAHHLHPFVIIGQQGLTPAVLHEIDVNLNAHELIKIRVFADDRDTREATLERICTELDAAPVQHIGKLLVVWRPAPQKEPSRAAPMRPAEKSAARKAPQSRRPRTPLPRMPARPPKTAPRDKPPKGAPAGARSRRGEPVARGGIESWRVDDARRRGRKSNTGPGTLRGDPRAEPKPFASARRRTTAEFTAVASGAKRPRAPHGKSASSTVGASGARRRRKAR